MGQGRAGEGAVSGGLVLSATGAQPIRITRTPMGTFPSRRNAGRHKPLWRGRSRAAPARLDHGDLLSSAAVRRALAARVRHHCRAGFPADLAVAVLASGRAPSPAPDRRRRDQAADRPADSAGAPPRVRRLCDDHQLHRLRFLTTPASLAPGSRSSASRTAAGRVAIRRLRSSGRKRKP